MLMIFQTITGENVMLPIDKTAFKEAKNENGIYTVAHFNNDEFKLKTTIGQIQQALSPRGGNIVPPETKDFMGLSGV